MPEFCLSCAKEDFKFSSAHFVAHGGGRERLHGHNYRVFVSLQGKSLGAGGVVMDFSELKLVVRKLCKLVAALACSASLSFPCSPRTRWTDKTALTFFFLTTLGSWMKSFCAPWNRQLYCPPCQRSRWSCEW